MDTRYLEPNYFDWKMTKYNLSLPRSAMGLFAVCDCGIYCSYSLTIFEKSNKI